MKVTNIHTVLPVAPRWLEAAPTTLTPKLILKEQGVAPYAATRNSKRSRH